MFVFFSLDHRKKMHNFRHNIPYIAHNKPTIKSVSNRERVSGRKINSASQVKIDSIEWIFYRSLCLVHSPCTARSLSSSMPMAVSISCLLWLVSLLSSSMLRHTEMHNNRMPWNAYCILYEAPFNS